MRKIKIIIADDEKECADELFHNLLKYKDIDILGIANSDSEEVNLIEKLRPDVVITDLMRENGETWGGLDIIRKYANNNSVKFLVTSYASKSLVFSKYKNIEGFIEKYPSINYDELSRAIRNIAYKTENNEVSTSYN